MGGRIFSIRGLDPSVWTAVKATAAAHGMTLGEYVERALRRALAEEASTPPATTVPVAGAASAREPRAPYAVRRARRSRGGAVPPDGIVGDRRLDPELLLDESLRRWRKRWFTQMEKERAAPGPESDVDPFSIVGILGDAGEPDDSTNFRDKLYGGK